MFAIVFMALVSLGCLVFVVRWALSPPLDIAAGAGFFIALASVGSYRRMA